MDLGVFLTALGFSVAIGFGGVAMMQFNPPKITSARGCFVFAAAIWILYYLPWELTTSLDFGFRTIGGIATAFAIGVLVPILWSWTKK